MSVSPLTSDEPELGSSHLYPLQVDNRFSLMGYSTAALILLFAAVLGLDDLTYASVLWYGSFGITFHLALEVAGRKRWISKRVHSIVYEIVGMLVWIASFAYAATLLDKLRPLLLIGIFLGT